MSAEGRGPVPAVTVTGGTVSRVLAVVTAAVLLKIGFVVSNVLRPPGDPVTVVTVFAIYWMALVAAVAGVTGVVTGDRSRVLAYATVASLAAAAVAVWVQGVMPRLGTDGMLFSRYSVDLLLAGENPYASSMDPAFDTYPISKEFVTYRTDGSVVTSLSYPALSFLWFLPQALLGVPNLNLTSVVALFAVLVFLVRESPAALSLAPVAVLFADPSIILFSYGGVFDVLWVLPLLVAMKFWSDRRFRAAAFVLGLAFATKQTPWFLAPFLAVWLYAEADSLRGFRSDLATCTAFGGAGFFLPNLPFVLWGPTAWFEGVMTPVAGGVPLVKQGRGLTLLSTSGVVGLPKDFFTVATLLVLATLLVAYLLYFDRLKWGVWLVPAVVLWFNYRSLQNYFVFFLPVAYYAVVLALEDASPADPAPEPVGDAVPSRPAHGPDGWKPVPSTDGGEPATGDEGGANGQTADGLPADPGAGDRETDSGGDGRTTDPPDPGGSEPVDGSGGGTPPWAPHREVSSRTRRRVLAATAGTALALGTGVGAVLAGRSLDVGATVTDWDDPHGWFRVSEITLRLENREDRPVEPGFHLLHGNSSTHYYWDVVAGPGRLAPGETAEYVVETTRPGHAVPYDTRVLLQVNDVGGPDNAQLPVRRFPSPAYDGVLNPSIDGWLYQYASKSKTPFRWVVARSDRGAERTEVERLDADGGARMRVSGLRRETGPWAMAGLTQSIPLSGTLRVEVTPHTVVDPRQYPPKATGIEVADREYRVWVLPSTADERVTIERRSGDLSYALVFVPAETGERSTLTVDLPAVYERMGWDLPPERDRSLDGVDYPARTGSLLAFAAAYPGVPASETVGIDLHRASLDPPG